MYVRRLLELPLFVLAFAAVLDNATTSPIDELTSRSELRDLNKIPLKRRIDERTESSSFTHYDEDSLRLVVDLNDDQKLKYDVEILEPRDVKKETAELEERFRGPSIKLDTDNFVAEDIEVNSGKVAGVNAAVRNEKANVDEATAVNHKNDHDDDHDDDDEEEEKEADGDKHNHIILTLVLVFVALLSITIYIALVLWRSYLERRYAERELLVSDDDDFYLPSSEAADRRW
ncbi:receptor-like kinase LIP2 [Ceratitis capitata]|uniref:receptor-like kinase LIP2 n=1 Tax=Ceratitis capitata TaxID=7213 RepID=UPI00032A18B6|nr:receptor-like kinase LIP2 [Ceratitis capitata]